MRNGLGALLVISLALAVRAFRLGASEPWFNEAYTGLVTHLEPAGILRAVREEISPPLYYLLLRGWSAIFGHAPEALRAFSVACGVLTAWVILRVAGRASRAAGLAAGLLVAIAPLHVAYSREARMYALLVLLVAASIAILLRAIAAEGSARRRWWTAYALLAAAAVWTHYHAIFALAAAPIAAGAYGRREMRGALLASLAAVPLVLPLVPWAIAQARLPATTHIEALYRAIPAGLAIPRTLELFTPGALFPAYPNFRFGAPLWRPAAFALLASALVPGLLAALRGEGEARRLARVALAFVLIPLALMSALSLVRPVYLLGRYDLVALPGFAILAGVGLALLPAPARAAAAIAGFVLAAASLAPLYTEAPASHAIARAVRATLVPGLRAGDVILYTGFAMPAARDVLLREGKDPRFVTLPRSTARHAGWVSRDFIDDAHVRTREAALAVRETEACLAPGGRIWLLADRRTPGTREAIAALRRAGYTPVALRGAPAGIPGRWSQPLAIARFERARVENPPGSEYSRRSRAP
jgi:hypothetical protein